MKLSKKLSIAVSCAALAGLAMNLVACGGNASGGGSGAKEPLKDKYSVNYNLNYDGGGVRAVELQAGQRAVDWNAVRDGHTLVGWYTDAACTNEYVFSRRIHSDLELYASWEKLGDTVTVKFDANSLGNTHPETAELVKGSKINRALAPDIDKIGFDLEGWYTDAECKNKWNFDTQTVDGDITLYANYTYDDSVYRDENGAPVFENVQINIWLSTDYGARDGLKEIVDKFNAEYEGRIRINANTNLVTQNLFSLRFQETANKNMGYENYYTVPDVYDLAGIECDYSRWYSGLMQDSMFDGSLCSVPMVAAVPYIVYNKDLMAKYNDDLRLPGSYTRFAQLLDAAYAGEARDNPSFTPAVTGNSWPYRVLGSTTAFLQNGAKYYDYKDGKYYTPWTDATVAAGAKTAFENIYAFLGADGKYGGVINEDNGKGYNNRGGNDNVTIADVARGDALIGVVNFPGDSATVVRNPDIGVMPLSGLYSDGASKNLVPAYSLGIGFYKAQDLSNTELAACAVFADYASKHSYFCSKSGWFPIEKSATSCDEFAKSDILAYRYMSEHFKNIGDPENFVSLYGNPEYKSLVENFAEDTIVPYLHGDGSDDIDSLVEVSAKTIGGRIAF